MLGAHCSAAGGVDRACQEAALIGANAVQLFTSNQRTWRGRQPFLRSEIDLWTQAKIKAGVECVVSHASYLINLGSEHDEVVSKSRVALREEVVRCQSLGIDFLVFHPGSSGSQNCEDSLTKIVEGLLSLQNELNSSEKPILLLESMAGQGSQLGKTFEELAFLLDRVDHRIPLSVCLDTCHLFAAGYDIRSATGVDQMLMMFDAKIGLSHLKLLHLNDSKKGLGSRLDRHASLGTGEIGWEAFHSLMLDSRTSSVPKILETPDGPNVWKEEIRHLKEAQSGASPSIFCT
ncbi:deoxyribonuclease IV [Candidatus Similichlamydia epinepheli]|uniref:deoxyribonuclease IV n=1 Tax=Candidatus Similichlamydia epinepheli TaxID=1903953 RepID=UPI000D3A86DE|nr:deoxyribonuclease IV [Candidatus Similichlamydia epinepheli]